LSENKENNAFDEETLNESVETAEESVEETVELSEEPVEDTVELSEEHVEDTVELSDEGEEVVAEVPEGTELDKELEEIRDYFQKELDKAKNGETDEDEDEADEEPVDEEKLCSCCGERERMDGREYCEDCYEAMRRYPFKWVYFLVAALAVYIAVLAVGKIGDINAGWVYAYEGDVLAEAGWYNEALEKYQYAQNYLYRDKVEPKMIYKRNLEVGFEQGGFKTINAYPTSVATIFEEWELKLPHMKKLKEYYMKAQEMTATIQKVNEDIFSQYSDTDAADLPYDEIIKQLSDYENRVLHIGVDEDGNEITEEPTTQETGTMSSSKEVYFKRATTYDTAMLQYFKYYFSTACDRPSEERIGYLEAVKANAPEMTWLYAGELGIEYAESGEKDKAIEYADMIVKKSETDAVSYYIRSLVAKNIDKDFDAAIKFCEEGNSYSENYELYRQITLNYLLLGDYEKAQENAQAAFDLNQDITTLNALAFCAVANKDDTKLEELQKLFDDYNEQLDDDADKLDFSKSVRDLKSGKMTVSEILEKGGYDLYD
jgi:tetratricopeptide (TPR) repeat protein